MFLSRLILNPRCRRVQAEAARPYELHRTIMAAFPAEVIPGSERVLFRLESDPRTGRLAVLVQSWQAPAWAHLAGLEFAGYLLPGSAANPAVKQVDLRFSAGQIVAFRLLANPTVKREGARLGLIHQEDQMSWLRRKAGDGGFRLVSANTSGQALVRQLLQIQIQKEDPASQVQARRKVTHLGVQFDGLLQVADPERLLETIRDGVGSAKGFGYGLLSVARPPE